LIQFIQIQASRENSPVFPNDASTLFEKLKECKNILYLGDNAGETVFDRILIEEIISKHKGQKNNLRRKRQTRIK